MRPRGRVVRLNFDSRVRQMESVLVALLIEPQLGKVREFRTDVSVQLKTGDDTRYSRREGLSSMWSEYAFAPPTRLLWRGIGEAPTRGVRGTIAWIA